MAKHSGQCLCGSVTYNMQADLTKTGGCHCAMCRAQNGGGPFYGVMCDSIDFETDDGLTWYKSSDWGERGFCRKCGTTLAWRMAAMPTQPVISIGSLSDASDVKIQHHIFTDKAGDYAPVPDNAPHKTAAQVLAQFAALNN